MQARFYAPWYGRFTGGNSSTQGHVKIGKQDVRVDLEYPTGESSGNLHIQAKGANALPKTFINSMKDFSKLPKSFRNNNKLKKLVENGLKKLEAARSGG